MSSTKDLLANKSGTWKNRLTKITWTITSDDRSTQHVGGLPLARFQAFLEHLDKLLIFRLLGTKPLDLALFFSGITFFISK
jgi:hypothetical protein